METTEELYNSAAELAKQFNKVVGKIKQRDRTAAAPAAASPAAAPGTAPGDEEKLPGASSLTTRRQQHEHPHQSQQKDKNLEQMKCQFDLKQVSELLKILLEQKEKFAELMAAFDLENETNNKEIQEAQNRKPIRQGTSPQQQQQQQQHRKRQCRFEPLPVTTNASNNVAVPGAQLVRVEPSELKLILKLESWISDNGSLVVWPSIQEDQNWRAASSATNSLSTAVQPGKNGDKSIDKDDWDVHLQEHHAAQKLPYRFNSGEKQQEQQQLGAIRCQPSTGGNFAPATAAPAGPKPSSVGFSSSRKSQHYSQFGGDGCQVNNHHDKLMDSRVSEGGSFCNDSVEGSSGDSSSDSDCAAATADVCGGAAPDQPIIQQLMDMLQKPDAIVRGRSYGR